MGSVAGVTKKRKQFTLKEKVDILRQVDDGRKQIDVCKEHGMALSTIATILRNRRKIMKLRRGSQLAPTRKRLRHGNYQKVDAAVLMWFKDARSQDVLVSGPMLQEKAQEFAVALYVTGFEASAGWLHRFCKRNGITWQAISGEAQAADAESAHTWRNGHFQEVIESYSEDDIFNADKMACFYQLLPNRTLHFKEENCKGGKKSKLTSFCAFLRQCHLIQETEAFGDWKVFETPLHEEYSVTAM